MRRHGLLLRAGRPDMPLRPSPAGARLRGAVRALNVHRGITPLDNHVDGRGRAAESVQALQRDDGVPVAGAPPDEPQLGGVGGRSRGVVMQRQDHIGRGLQRVTRVPSGQAGVVDAEFVPDTDQPLPEPVSQRLVEFGRDRIPSVGQFRLDIIGLWDGVQESVGRPAEAEKGGGGLDMDRNPDSRGQGSHGRRSVALSAEALQ